MITRFTGAKTIPSVTTRKSSPMTTNFAKGIFTYKPNDTMDFDEIRLAQDARFDRVGEYMTRRGLSRLAAMEPIGKSVLSQSAVWSSRPNQIDVNEVLPYVFTATKDALIYSVEVNCYCERPDSYFVPMLTLSVNGEKVATSCVGPDISLHPFFTYEAVFLNTPKVRSGDEVTISLGTQDGRPAAFQVDTRYTDNVIKATVNTCTEGAIDSVFEANIEGEKTILFVQNAALYRTSEDGTVTKIRDLPAGTKKVRFCQNLNQVRYADGLEGPRLLDPANGWADTPIPTVDLETDTDLEIKVSNIMNGAQADNMIYFNSDVDTEAVWTWPYGYEYAPPIIYTTTFPLDEYEGGREITLPRSSVQALTSKTVTAMEAGDRMYGPGAIVAEVEEVEEGDFNVVSVRIVNAAAVAINSYDKFSRNFYQNFPAILTGDPITAMFNLGGVYYFLTRRNKYQMYAQTADNWSQGSSSAQNGTFSQESVVCDLNYAYFANDSGIYQFDGSSERSLTQRSIQNVYDAIPNKEQIVVDMHGNRLYVFYPSVADGANDHCLVYNTKLGVWESFDSNTYVSAASGRQNASNRLICGHSRIGLLMLAEDSQNDYSDMGQPIAFNLETAYHHFGSTSQLKRIPKWRPEFGSTGKDYTVQCGYALDFSDKVRYAFSVDLKNNKVMSEDYTWDDPSDYHIGSTPTVHTTLPQVYGEFYRCQIRYQHIAAFEPVIFKSHTLTTQTQRIR